MQREKRKKEGSAKPASPAKRQQQGMVKANQKSIDLFFKKPTPQTVTIPSHQLQQQEAPYLSPTATIKDIIEHVEKDKENRETEGSLSHNVKQLPANLIANLPPPPTLVDTEIEIKEEATDTTETPFFGASMYTDQIHHMLSTVLDGESFLFTSDQLQKFKQFERLDVESQHLFVRLWMRKQRRWLRLNKLDYSSNIRDIHKAARSLANGEMAYIYSNDVTTLTMEWSDVLRLLTVDELKTFAQSHQCQLKEGKARADYVKALTVSRQQALDSKALHDLGEKDVFLESAKLLLGTCIILDESYSYLFQRLNIVYYRLDDPAELNSITASILSKLSRRHYPDYVYYRTSNVWTTIEELDHYENAFRLKHEFETKMESIPFEKRRRQLQQQSGTTSLENSNDEEQERNSWMECWVMCENIIGTWEELLRERIKKKDDDGDDHRFYYMRRFEAGYVYTHMIEHGTKALAKLQEYSLEALILQKLIDQHVYRLGKRGKWYDRLALIQANYLKDIPERKRKKMALQTCINGVQDPRVHQTQLSALQRRIQRLERDLCIPRREQHDFSYLTLKKPTDKIIHAERISDSITGKKSSWRGDDGAEISVEEVAIQYYNKQGYQGLHTENGVITMLFMLLFWDIVFAPVPGAFETPYQTAPLDLWSDAFYVERIGIINERVDLIGQENSIFYLDIIKKVDDEQRPLQTLCAGVNWNYDLVHLLEVAECIGPQALSSLCRLLAEEFGHRLGGMPDLCCWNYDKKECLFVEVKGPGDKLSETQKIWLDTLSNMGIAAEVCYVKVWDGEDELLKEDKT